MVLFFGSKPLPPPQQIRAPHDLDLVFQLSGGRALRGTLSMSGRSRWSEWLCTSRRLLLVGLSDTLPLLEDRNLPTSWARQETQGLAQEGCWWDIGIEGKIIRVEEGSTSVLRNL